MRISLLLCCALAVGCTGMPTTTTDTSGVGTLADRLATADQALREARLLDAEIAYRQLSIEHPQLPDVWLRLGNIHVRQAQLDAAVHSYQQGLKRHPQDGRLWYNLALTRLRQSLDTLETASAVIAADAPHRASIQRFHHRLLQLAAPPPSNEGTP